MYGTITIIYSCDKKIDIIDQETDSYVYFTDGWNGTKKRYDKDNHILSQELKDGTWEPFADNDKIIEVKIGDEIIYWNEVFFPEDY